MAVSLEKKKVLRKKKERKNSSQMSFLWQREFVMERKGLLSAVVIYVYEQVHVLKQLLKQ